MRIDLEPPELGGAGIVIEGDVEELEGLVETLEHALEHGSAKAAMLDPEGVEDVLVRCLPR